MQVNSEMKFFTERLIRFRNPAFSFDPTLSNQAILHVAWMHGWSLLRGLGLLLRFRAPKWALFERGVLLSHLSSIRWGKYLRLGKHVFVSGMGDKGVFFGDKVSIGAFSRIVVSTTMDDIGSYIRIGDNVGIGEFAYLGGAGGLKIGDNCIIGQYFSCHPENHLFDNAETLIKEQGVVRKGIKIGKNCWIGSKVTILDNVQIGDGCVIAAGAVVHKSFPPNTVIGGVPARAIKKRRGNL